MIIDCGTCVARHTDACDDCIVNALCGPMRVLELDEEERSAIDAMSELGLVRPIRLVVEDERRRSTGA
ncbi:MAG: hypothetical protein ACR2N2_05925 [Acidimicrobiia bacterium]